MQGMINEPWYHVFLMPIHSYPCHSIRNGLFHFGRLSCESKYFVEPDNRFRFLNNSSLARRNQQGSAYILLALYQISLRVRLSSDVSIWKYYHRQAICNCFRWRTHKPKSQVNTIMPSIFTNNQTFNLRAKRIACALETIEPSCLAFAGLSRVRIFDKLLFRSLCQHTEYFDALRRGEHFSMNYP